MTTQRQIDANRLNSLKSTGPTSIEGREISRRNALKHGLSGKGIVLPEKEAEVIAQRKAEWKESFRPENELDVWLVEQVAVASVQVERCQAQEDVLREQYAGRVADHWEADRRLAAEILAEGLSKKPSLVIRQLERTPQGCDCLIERWEALGLILEHKGDWTEKQRSLALDLLGTPPELRDGPTKLDPRPGTEAKAHRAAIVAVEVKRLTHAKTALAASDTAERAAAATGVEYDVPRPLALLRRYLRSCQYRLRWALNQLRHGKPGRAGRPAAGPSPIDLGLTDEEDPAALFAALDPRSQAALSEFGALDRLMSEPPPPPPLASPAAPPPVVKPAPAPEPCPERRPAVRCVSYPDHCFVPISATSPTPAPTARR
jgi:hypothetical protein